MNTKIKVFDAGGLCQKDRVVFIGSINEKIDILISEIYGMNLHIDSINAIEDKIKELFGELK